MNGSEDNERAPGDSAEQRHAEGLLIQNFCQQEGLDLQRNKRVFLGGRAWFELDGFCENPLIFCEAWAHQGPPKSAQTKKIMGDAFKLIFAEKHFGKNARKILLFADERASKPFRGNSWMAAALQNFGIETIVVELSQDVRNVLLKAQHRQFR